MQRHFAPFVCALTVLGAGVSPGLAAVSATGGLPGAAAVAPVAADLGKEMTVQNWVLCTTEDNAESIAKARIDGVAPALKVYGGLLDAKACGQFPALRVILQQSLYQSPPDDLHDTRVYRATVNIGSGWPTGFLIYGGLGD